MFFWFSKLDSSALVLKMQHDKNYIWIDDTEISACLPLKKENVNLRWEDFRNDHVSIIFVLIINQKRLDSHDGKSTIKIYAHI